MSCCRRAQPRSTFHRVRSWALMLGAAALAVLFAWDFASAEVYHSRESALALAFPSPDSVSSRQVILETDQVEAILERSGVKVSSRLVNVYVGKGPSDEPRYAYFDTHRVRTLPETLMVVVGPEGTAEAVHLLAFHEPPAYRASDRWLGQFEGRELDREMALDRGIAGIGGATLTANVVTATVRRILATHELAVAADIGPDVASESAPSH